MIINDNELGLTGATICGKQFFPADEDSAYAIFDLGTCPCGVTVEKGVSNPYLRFTPGIQIPKEARAGFERFQFEWDDEDIMDLTLDANDGEVVLRRDLESLEPAEIERVLSPALAWLGEQAYPALLSYVASCVRSDA